MERIIILEKAMPRIGLFTRAITQGDEFILVKQFIEFYCNRFLRDNKKHNLAVFIEPRLPSGFPDIVFASYLPNIMDNWSEERMKLNLYDLKILSHLISVKGVSGASLISSLKLPEKQTIISLEKLLDAKLITYRYKNWRPRELRDIFSIRKLVSVEAKINNVSRVVEQSFLNTWFTSHSYALTNVSKPHDETLKTFFRRGVGLYCKKKSFQEILKAKKFALPSSYLSLQFNEWIGNNLAV